MADQLPGHLDAFIEQSAAVADWLDDLPAEALDSPSSLDGWDVRMLVAHLALVRNGLERALSVRSTEPAITASQFVGRYRPAVEAITKSTLALYDSQTPAELIARLRDADSLREAGVGVSDRTTVLGGRGPITAVDWATTRLVEVVIHSDDLARSFPEREPVPLHRAALATAVRTLAEIFATAHPGRSVEVRIAPFVAVQAVPGPRHTRGTPPNVVETDPLTWIRVATGRAVFADAVADGRIAASGNRADLTPYLPVLS